jgi:hypothetical protein
MLPRCCFLQTLSISIHVPPWSREKKPRSGLGKRDGGMGGMGKTVNMGRAGQTHGLRLDDLLAEACAAERRHDGPASQRSHPKLGV